MGLRVEIRNASGSQSFTCAAGERLLYAGLSGGADLPYGCATGTCGNCKATLLTGEVETVWKDAPGGRALKKQGEILLCQTAPLRDCVLEARAGNSRHQRDVPTTHQAYVSSVACDEDGLAWVVLKLHRPMRFLAGQFVLVAVPGVEGFRAYSPAHDGAYVTELALVVREKPGGGVSPLLCGQRQVGTPVTVFGPLGTAHVHPAQDQDMAVLVGGSGSGVALSLLDWARATGHLSRHRIDVVCGLRTLRSRQVIDRLAAAAKNASENLRIVVALSDEPAEQDLPAPIPGLTYERGFAHEVASQVLPAAEWKRRAVFVAGPAPMVEASMRMLLVRAKLSPTKIRYDSFS
jgi:toluene monooxygenase electron transfer component